ncbi:MAG: phosphatidylinositol mannoside acyltransferase [Nitriliruptorales bacterium]
MSLRQRATYLSYRAAWGLAAALPDAVAWRLPGPLGYLSYHLVSDRRRDQVRANFRRVAGDPPPEELERLVQAVFASYSRYWLDAFRAHTFSVEDVMARTEQVGLEIIEDLLADGEGIVLATGHLGSWDMGGFFAESRDWHLSVVAEVVEPRALFERFVRLRRELGMDVIPLEEGGSSVDRLEQVVHSGGIATLLADRDLTGNGPVVDFFGEPCRLPPGPAALARRTGRPIVPGAFFTTPHGWRAVVHEPLDISGLDVEAGTQQVALALERLIGEAPHQWHVIVPHWLADREPDHPALQDRAEDTPAPPDRAGDTPAPPGDEQAKSSQPPSSP